MAETKWTPGPWVATPSRPPQGYGCYWITTTGAMEKEVAEVSGPQTERHEANAHLIAAAPDLYAALETLVGVADTLDSTGRIDAAVWLGVGAAARAALAKARGEA